MVHMSDLFAHKYCNELFPINSFHVTAIHDPATMHRVAVFPDVNRKAFKEGCIERRLSYLSDPDELLGELASILGDFPSAATCCCWHKESKWFADGKLLTKNQFPPLYLIATVPMLDAAIGIPEVRAHATPPYLEVMHPLKPLRIPDFGPDLRTGQLWGNARADVVEEFLLDIVINHPVTPLGWTHAEAPPAHIVTSVTHDWPKARAHLSSSPVPDKVIQRMLGLLVPAELHGDEKGSHALQAAIRTQADTEQRAINAIREKGDAGLDEEAQRLNGIDKWPRRPDPDGKEVPMDAFPTDTGIVVMTALDEAMHYAQVTGRYVLVTVHSDNSSQASRTLNHRLWYNEPLQFTISTKYVLVRLDADMEPMAKLVLNTPVTSSEPDEQAHAATPYLEVMHPLETLRIPVFGTDPKTGVMWGDALPHIVEAFLLDLVIKHPVAALGWTPADAPPPRTDAGGDGTGALAAMDDASGVTGIAGHASDDAAWDLIE
ncbi:hypothetical protein GGF31_008107 [Allomyces arbusculus]|nr:hypothetical protein GGF31_008107 [Allomyces arbusculus]